MGLRVLGGVLSTPLTFMYFWEFGGLSDTDNGLWLPLI